MFTDRRTDILEKTDNQLDRRLFNKCWLSPETRQICLHYPLSNLGCWFLIVDYIITRITGHLPESSAICSWDERLDPDATFPRESRYIRSGRVFFSTTNPSTQTFGSGEWRRDYVKKGSNFLFYSPWIFSLQNQYIFFPRTSKTSQVELNIINSILVFGSLLKKLLGVESGDWS